LLLLLPLLLVTQITTMPLTCPVIRYGSTDCDCCSSGSSAACTEAAEKGEGAPAAAAAGDVVMLGMMLALMDRAGCMLLGCSSVIAVTGDL
jgi:hypothetical protein